MDLTPSPASSVGNADAVEAPLRGVHRGIAKLPRRHLPQPLETADLYLSPALEMLGDQPVAVFVVTGVERLSALAHAVERRDGEVKMAVVDQLPHLAEEKRHQERSDVRAVHVGVGHDDDALIAQLVVVVIDTTTAAQRLHQDPRDPGSGAAFRWRRSPR